MQMVIAGLGVLVTAAGVVLANVDWPKSQDGRTETAATSNPASTTAKSPRTAASTAGTAVGERHLAQLTPVEGVGSVELVAPNELDMQCGTNQSDDRSREVVYALPAEYSRVLVDATPTGQADPESLTEVSIFVHDRYDRSDRERQVAVNVVPLNATQRLEADIPGVRAVTMRIRCQSPDVTVRFSDPRVIR
jgi:hypothetical protein